MGEAPQCEASQRCLRSLTAGPGASRESHLFHIPCEAGRWGGAGGNKEIINIDKR